MKLRKGVIGWTIKDGFHVGKIIKRRKALGRLNVISVSKNEFLYGAGI